MSDVPGDPKFLCGHCSQVICDDCKSIAGEYEFLYEQQKYELNKAMYRYSELEKQVDRLKREAEMWQAVSKAGLPVIIQAWMDDEAAKARKAGRDTARRESRVSGLLAKLKKAEKTIAQCSQSGK